MNLQRTNDGYCIVADNQNTWDTVVTVKVAYKFTLDGFGRISGASYEDSDQIFYNYNTEGDLGLVRHGDLITRYYYDFQGELRGVDTSDGTNSSSVRWTQQPLILYIQSAWEVTYDP